MRQSSTLLLAVVLGLAAGFVGAWVRAITDSGRDSVEQRFVDLERRIRFTEDETRFLVERTDRLSSTLDRPRDVFGVRTDQTEGGRPATPTSETAAGVTDATPRTEPPPTAIDAIERCRRERHPEDIDRAYRRLVQSQVSDLEPELTERQAQTIQAYLSTGSGKDWLDTRDAIERFLLQLPDAEQARLVQRDAELENDVRTFIKNAVLTSEQLRYFPYGKSRARESGAGSGR